MLKLVNKLFRATSATRRRRSINVYVCQVPSVSVQKYDNCWSNFEIMSLSLDCEDQMALWTVVDPGEGLAGLKLRPKAVLRKYSYVALGFFIRTKAVASSKMLDPPLSVEIFCQVLGDQ